jgi:hypothetical protein
MEDFLKEFKELLAKYNVAITADADSCSDMHGVIDPYIEIYTYHEKTFCVKELHVIEGWDIDKDRILKG